MRFFDTFLASYREGRAASDRKVDAKHTRKALLKYDGGGLLYTEVSGTHTANILIRKGWRVEASVPLISHGGSQSAKFFLSKPLEGRHEQANRVA